MGSKCIGFFLLVLQSIGALSQVFPSEVILPPQSSAVNGSSAIAHCSNVTQHISGGTECLDPTSSVLFDGHTPTLTGLDGNMWASQLLTVNMSHTMPTKLTVSFTNTPNYVGAVRLEVGVFNCPEWGAEIDTIRVTETLSQKELGTVNPDQTSCQSLVKVCLPSLWTSKEKLDLNFYTLNRETQWMAIGEISFFGEGEYCPSGSGTTAATPTTTATGVESTTTTTSVKASDHSTTATFSKEQQTPELDSQPPCTSVCTCSIGVLQASIITAIATALLTSVFFILVQIAVCRRFLTRVGSRSQHSTAPHQHPEDGVYEQVQGGHYDVPKGNPCSSIYDVPKQGDSSTSWDPSYVAVEGRVLVTATNRIATTENRGSFEDEDSLTHVPMVGLTVNNDNGRYATSSKESDNVSYSNVDVGERSVPLKRNEAYAAAYHNTPH